MYKSILLLIFVVSSAVNASPSVDCVEMPTACVKSTTPVAQCDGRVAGAVASLQHTNRRQAKTIEGLMRSLHNVTTPTPPHIAELVLNAVSSAVAPLQQTIQQQALAIEGLIQSAKNQTTPTPLCASNEFVTSTIQSAVATVLKAIEQQAQTKSSMKPAQNSTTPLPAPQQKPRSASCGHDTGYRFYPETRSCYKLNKTAMIWPAANVTCHAEGAYLAVINSPEEAQILDDIVRTGHPEQAGGAFWALIGVYRDSDHVWRTVTGETPEKAVTTPGYNPWHNGYPKNEDQNGYGVIVYSSLENVHSRWAHSSICEKTPEYQ